MTSTEAAATGATGERARRRRSARRRDRFRVSAFSVALVGLAASIPALGWLGYQTLLDSRGGRVVDRSIPDGAANHETVVQPTPVALILHATDDELAGVTVVALRETDGRGGGVLFIPPETVVASESSDAPDIAAAYHVDGASGAGQVVAELLGIGFTEVLVVDDGRWAQFAGPLTPLTLSVPGVEGPVVLEAADVGPFLSDRNEDGTIAAPADRAERHERFWRAWLRALDAAGNPAAVPGEGTRGMSRYVRGLADGPIRYRLLPGTDTEDGAFAPDASAIQALVAALVEYPVGAEPGDRIRVRVLDGAGDDARRDQVSRALVANGAQIVVIGNADRFDYRTTRVLYGSGVPRTSATALRDAIGFGEVEDAVMPDESYDVTVIVGRDVADG